MSKKNAFWVSYSDLMTSLFFIVLVLYMLTFTFLKVELHEGRLAKKKIERIKEIEKALNSLDKEYFEFNDENKRYKLTIDARFKSGSDLITDIPFPIREELYQAGLELYNRLTEVIDKNPNVDYLLIIEGNTQRSNNNWIRIPNKGYKLSYERALSLYNYWKSRGLDFRKIGVNCEVILAGSGYFGHSRDNKVEFNNRRFSIQVTSKIGQLIK